MKVKITLPPPLDLLWVAIRGWSKDNVPRLGASLAYYTLFAISPIVIIAVSIAGLVFGPDAVRGELVSQMEGLVGAEGARAIQSLLQGVQRSGSGDLAFTVGTVTFVIAATGAFMELQHALNTVFRVKTRPGQGLKRLIIKRLK
jgi:membrane protein